MITMTLIILLMIPPIALFFAIMIPLLYLKKKLSNKGKTRWAFFHPFWYKFDNKVMMEVEGKKCFGAWSKNSLKKPTIKSLFTAFSQIKKQ